MFTATEQFVPLLFHLGHEIMIATFASGGDYAKKSTFTEVYLSRDISGWEL